MSHSTPHVLPSIDFGDDIYLEIICYLDAVSVVRLLGVSKRLWKLHEKQIVCDRILPYKKDIIKAQWNAGLIVATSRNNIPQVQYFIEKGADNINGGLQDAARNGNVPLVLFFVERGACRWNNALMQAVLGGHKNLVEYFTEKGAMNWNSAILYALQEGNQEMITLCEQKMAQCADFIKFYWKMVNVIKRGNLQELSEAIKEPGVAKLLPQLFAPACRKGRRDIVELLAQHTTPIWRYLLDPSCQSGNRELIDLIISKMENPTTEQNEWNYGMRSALWGGHREIVELMIKQGANDWDMGLYDAAKLGDKQLVEMFIQEGATNFSSAIGGAAQGGHHELVEYFLRIGKHTKFQWKSVIEDAIISGNEDLVKFMVLQADRTTGWSSAVQKAIYTGHPRMIELFIRRGANNWNLFLNTAIQAEDLNLVKYFLQKGASVEEVTTLTRCKQKDILDFFDELKQKKSAGQDSK